MAESASDRALSVVAGWTRYAVRHETVPDMSTHRFDDVSIAELRARRSAKWSVYPEEVLPAWVAEMDYPLADPIARALHGAIDRGDAGYATRGQLGAVFARWAAARWGWTVAPRDVHLVCDVVTGIAEILRVATEPGDAVVIEPPVYPPFAGTVRTLGRRVASAPLVQLESGGWSTDLGAVEDADRKGARVHLLCSPQNPTGLVYQRDTLAALAALAARYGVLILSDEIHAPLALPGAVHVPLPSVSEEARETSIVITSASKAWNVAGLKAAVMVASGSGPRSVLAKLPPETPYHAGHFGVIAGTAAFTDGDPWLTETIAILDRNRTLLAELLRAQLPAAAYVPPRAGYLAWIDLRAVPGAGDDPARVMLERGRVALSSGPTFGDAGKGFARLNFATTRALLEQAVARMAAAFAKR